MKTLKKVRPPKDGKMLCKVTIKVEPDTGKVTKEEMKLRKEALELTFQSAMKDKAVTAKSCWTWRHRMCTYFCCSTKSGKGMSCTLVSCDA